MPETRQPGRRPRSIRKTDRLQKFIESLRRSLQASEALDLSNRDDLQAAGVLIPVRDRGGVPHLVLTLRTETVAHHKGQISFPGGGFEPVDADLAACALRETREEIGIADVDLLGPLDQMTTPTGFRVAPFVGVIPSDAAYLPCEEEVACVIELPVSHLVEHFQRLTVRRGQREVVSFAVEFEGSLIWGVTGWILRSFLRHVAPDRDYDQLPISGLHLLNRDPE